MRAHGVRSAAVMATPSWQTALRRSTPAWGLMSLTVLVHLIRQDARPDEAYGC